MEKEKKNQVDGRNEKRGIVAKEGLMERCVRRKQKRKKAKRHITKYYKEEG